MKKINRQRLMAELMEKFEIKKQEDFVEKLKEIGVQVTQATVSRDIKEMHLIKVPSKDEGYRYSLPLKKNKNSELYTRLQKLLNTSLIQCTNQNEWVFLKTQPGTAAAISSLVEEYFQKEIFAILSDDNHVLLMVATENSSLEMKEKLLNMLTKE